MKQLLLLHGAIGAKDQFNDVAAALATDYEIHTLNFAGHGGEAIPDDNFSIPLFAQNVIEYMDENNINTIDIFGYSMGGYVALYLALYFPERIEDIFTLATKFNWDETIAAKEAAMLNPETITVKIPAFAATLAERHSTQNWKTVLSKTAAMMLEMGKKNILSENDYRTIKHKVQVALGDRDKMVSLAETLQVFNYLTNKQLLVLPGVQHPFENIPLQRLTFEIKTYFGV